MEKDGVPAALARLWRLPLESQRGRPARLDVDMVVDAAVALADARGLSAATLPRVAESLGVTKMSLYRYVGSKDELLTLMSDAAQGPVPDGLPEEGHWRERLRAWAVAIARAVERHPWLADVPMTGPPSGPNSLDWLDAGLRALRDTRLDWGEKIGSLMIVSGHVRTSVRLANELAAGRDGTGLDQAASEREYGRAMARLVTAERFPEAAALFASGVFEDTGEDTADHDFHFGLELVLDGVAAAVARAERRG